jgi:hypothetical protein
MHRVPRRLISKLLEVCARRALKNHGEIVSSTTALSEMMMLSRIPALRSDSSTDQLIATKLRAQQWYVRGNRRAQFTRAEC